MRLLCTLILSLTAVVCTALWNTAIGKVMSIIIAGWLAVNVFGLDLTTVESVTTTVKDNPHVIVDTALEWLL